MLTETFVDFYFAASLAGLLIASWTDFKTREIPDRLTQALLVLGLGGHLLQAVLESNAWIFIESALLAALTFGGAYGLWRLGVWAGGDVKLFAALAALNPVNYGGLRDLFGLDSTLLGLKSGLFASLPIPLFPLTLFVFSVLSMMPYGVLLSCGGLAKSPPIRARFLLGLRKRLPQLGAVTLMGMGFLAIAFDFGLGEWMAWPMLIAASFLPGLWWYLVALGAFGYAFSKYGTIAAVEAGYFFLPIAFLYIFIKLYLVSKDEVLRENIPAAQLAEGMIPAQTLVEAQPGRRVIEFKSISFSELFAFARKLDFKGLQARLVLPTGRVLAHASRAAGLTGEEAAELRQLAQKGIIPSFLRVKRSAPFVPAVLIGFLFAQLIGDFLWKMVFA